ncbi:MAG: glycosyltransferase family 9 protein, partial [Hyphomonadaceae bacterium]
ADSGARDFGEDIRPFTEFAALIESLDLVVSIDTSVAHLAGALDKPVLLLLPMTAEWRWLREREDTPWYPKTRLLRQQRFGDWSAPIAAAHGAIAAFQP